METRGRVRRRGGSRSSRRPVITDLPSIGITVALTVVHAHSSITSGIIIFTISAGCSGAAIVVVVVVVCA